MAKTIVAQKMSFRALISTSTVLIKGTLLDNVPQSTVMTGSAAFNAVCLRESHILSARFTFDDGVV